MPRKPYSMIHIMKVLVFITSKVHLDSRARQCYIVEVCQFLYPKYSHKLYFIDIVLLSPEIKSIIAVGKSSHLGQTNWKPVD